MDARQQQVTLRSLIPLRRPDETEKSSLGFGVRGPKSWLFIANIGEGRALMQR
jgi:hypothetical protein